MRPLLLLLAVPVLFVTGCTTSSHRTATATATPTTAPAAPTSAASASAGPVDTGTPSGPARTGTPSGPAKPGSPTGTKSGGGAAGTATPRCHTGDLKLTLGKRGGDTATKFQPLYFTNVARHACTLHGFPGVSAVAGDDRHQVGEALDRATFNPKVTLTLAPGDIAYAILGLHDVGMFPASRCKPVSVRGYRVYPPDETKSVFVASATKVCSAKDVNVGNVAAILIHPVD
ncbi:DUF4232 domain-containing protein [Paractinoplanes toevensis]|uniref:DUF4232 domain-containing protein n=1 Tax=Paractinoplanes toevensis TaxID=571911 RepID=A0A919W8S9_9ACTN|nr:DUF4232 domain-containing protein [Actinoplanes toevensis]GIM95451.1 hypothetical protein Ato02nite_072440 [Actinoplanes toevensis]